MSKDILNAVASINDFNRTIDADNYCGNCNYFLDRVQCPFFDIINKNTKWKDIPCNEFIR